MAQNVSRVKQFKKVLLIVPVIALLLVVLVAPVQAVDNELIYTGTPRTFGNVDDAVNGPVNLGFTFNYFGTDYTQGYVSTNGILSFGTNSAAYSNSSTGLTSSIHAFWDDLILQTGTSNVYTATVGEVGSRKFITQWTNMYFFNTTITMGTFQAIVYEGSNDIRIQYRDLLGGARSNGNSATIGIKNNGSTFLMYSNNTEAITEGQSILYSSNGSGGYTVDDAASYDPVYLQSSDAPDSPTLVNPQNAITGATTTPTFEWLAANQATSYQVLVSTRSDFATTVVNQSGITGTSYTLGSALSYNTTYYWRVAGVNASGNNLSSSRTFTTSGSPNVAPNTPASIAPDGWNNGAGIGSAVLAAGGYGLSLSDDDSGDQVRYRMQIATDNGFSDLVLDYRSAFGAQGVTSFNFGTTDGTYLTGASDTALADGDYYVRFRAEDGASASSAWSAISGVAFSLDATAPIMPIKPVQVGDATSSSVTIGWEAATDLDLALAPYRLEYSTDPTFASYSTVLTDATSKTLTGLSSDRNYYARLVVLDHAGNASEASPVLTVFILAATIPTPAITTPPATSTTPGTSFVTKKATSSTTPAPSVASNPTPSRTVRVMVVDKDGQPIAGAKVTLYSVPRVAYTDNTGVAEFTDVESGQHTAVVEYKKMSSQAQVEVLDDTSAIASENAQAEVRIELPVETIAAVKVVKNSTAWWLWLALVAMFVVFILLAAKRRRKKSK